MLLPRCIAHNIDILHAGVVHLCNDAKGAAIVRMQHSAADQIINKIAALRQFGIRLGKIVGFAHLGAGGIHILHPGQLDQQHIALGAHPAQRNFAAAVCGSVQALELGQELCAVAQRQGFHFAADTVGGNNFAGGQIVLHRGNLLE